MKRVKAGCVVWCAILSLIAIPISHPWRIRKDNPARPFPGSFSDQSQFQSQLQHAGKGIVSRPLCFSYSSRAPFGDLKNGR